MNLKEQQFQGELRVRERVVRMPPESSSRSVHIPVQKRGSTFEFLYGRSLPEIRDRTKVYLIVPLDSLSPEDRAAFEKLHTEPLLPKGTRLLVLVQATVFADELLIPSSEAFAIPVDGAFVEVELQEDLTILLRGTKPPILSSCPCYIPRLDIQARSLNHAYSLISERYEPHRASHTGNVFQKVFRRSADGTWEPLEALRKAAQKSEEERLGEHRRKVAGTTSWFARVASRLKT